MRTTRGLGRLPVGTMMIASFLGCTSPDGGASDATGVVDAGSVIDAGAVVDAGEPDAGEPDAGEVVDAGEADGGGQASPDIIGRPCATDEDCEGGFCLSTIGGQRACTIACLPDDDCHVAGWLCALSSEAVRDVCRCTGLGTESCNGIDDDCDGEVDEGSGEALGCAGATVCVEGGCVCIASGAETCNGVDDDCDGEVDEGADEALGCGPDEGCQGACLCSEASCQGGYANWPLPGTPGHPRSYVILETTVLDEVTGLEWQRGVSPMMTWDDAVSYCEDLELAGQSDWRLPARMELVSLLDASVERGIVEALATDSIVWTSSLLLPDGEDRMFWGFSSANHGFAWLQKTWDFPKTRCVRSATWLPPPAQRFVPLGEATVAAAGTGLVWEKEAWITQSLSAGAERCAALDLDGHTWRMPSVTELLSIVDVSRIRPALDTDVFTGNDGPQLVFHLSSDVSVADGGRMGVNVTEGYVSSLKDVPYDGLSIRCVRDVSGASCSQDASCGAGRCVDMSAGARVCALSCRSHAACPASWSCLDELCRCEGDGNEICNGRDDDCDGLIDEGEPVALGCGELEVCDGICR